MAELPVDHLSYSSLSAYWTCPRAWRFRYVDRIPTLPTPSLVFGSAFHQAVEKMIHPQLARPGIEELWTECWGKATQQEIDWQGELPDELYNLGARMLGHEDTLQLLTTIDPAVDECGPMIERQVKLLVPGVSVPVIGYLDMLDMHGVPHDFKTSAKMWTQAKAAEEMQPLFYLAALNQMGCEVGLRFVHVVFAKTKTPQAQAFLTEYTIAQVFWLMSAIRETWAAISAGAFPPNPGSWACSSKWCPYWGQCRGKG